jgi:hypothetical protein
MKSIPFNERHEIGGIEWSAAEVLQMREEAENNEKAYRDALEKILFDEKRKSEKQLTKKVDEMKISEEKPAKSASRTPANDKEAIQDWLDDILDM